MPFNLKLYNEAFMYICIFNCGLCFLNAQHNCRYCGYKNNHRTNDCGSHKPRVIRCNSGGCKYCGCLNAHDPANCPVVSWVMINLEFLVELFDDIDNLMTQQMYIADDGIDVEKLPIYMLTKVSVLKQKQRVLMH